MPPQVGIDLASQITCPILLIHGDKDSIAIYANALSNGRGYGRAARHPGGIGHAPHVREPVRSTF